MVGKTTSFSLCCFYLLAAVLCACHAPQQASLSSGLPEQEAAQTRPVSPSATPEEINPLSFGLTGGVPRGDEAWRRFIADGRYRVARASDFTFSEAARVKGGRDLEIGQASPYMAGDIKRDDDRFRDAAVIVVDTARDDAERFGLVIFAESKDSETVPEPYWFYRDRDMSRTLLSWDSEGLNLRTYQEDGTFTVCRVKWNQRQREYRCK